jgi:serine/threonine-protein kinase
MLVLLGAWAVVFTLAGGVSGTNGDFVDASGTNAGFSDPYGVAVDASGTVFVADSLNNRIRKVTADGGTWIEPAAVRAR